MQNKAIENNLSKSKVNRYLNGKRLVFWSNARIVTLSQRAEELAIFVCSFGGLSIYFPILVARLIFEIKNKSKSEGAMHITLTNALEGYTRRACVFVCLWVGGVCVDVYARKLSLMAMRRFVTINYRLGNKSRISFRQPINHHQQWCCNTKLNGLLRSFTWISAILVAVTVLIWPSNTITFIFWSPPTVHSTHHRAHNSAPTETWYLHSYLIDFA